VADRSVAVVDIGSNSGRVVVIRVGDRGELEILANGRAPLRLGRDLAGGDRLSAETIEHTAAAVRDFRSIGESARADTLIAVATSAVRESSNADEFVAAVEAESGVRIRVIDGEDEARYTFLGAVRGLPVEHGIVGDLGGGSLELTRFRDRRAVRSWTLPLGSLRLSDRFLRADPPTAKETAALARFARTTLAEAGVDELRPDERLIGTGGTIRNLAKIDMASTRYPIPRLHGYLLARSAVEDTGDRLASRPLSRRRGVRGLSRERADSIVGGTIAVRSLMEHLSASELTVSGRGLREGVALDSASPPDASIEEIRSASVLALARRFSAWDRERAERRRAIAEGLLRCVEPDAGATVRERLVQAATLLDVGRSVDYYRRFDHTADIVIEADLDCFSHRKLALLSAVVRQAGDRGISISRYHPLLGRNDVAPVARSATLLALADTIEQHLPPGPAGDVLCRVQGKRVLLDAPVHDPWRRDALAERFRAAFAKRLQFTSARSG
jgi:exopolyphosphatase / guanosine-5'-triphosphate,3'-diphosphate pyrophosphatase